MLLDEPVTIYHIQNVIHNLIVSMDRINRYDLNLRTPVQVPLLWNTSDLNIGMLTSEV